MREHPAPGAIRFLPRAASLTLMIGSLLCAQLARAEATPAPGGQEPGTSLLDAYAGPSGPTPELPADPGAAKGAGSAILPAVWCSDVTDATTREACWETYRAGLAYHAKGLAHRSDVFEWQLLTARLIFVVVLLLVGTGVYFSWVQFQRGDSSEAHELEIGTGGLKVSSPVLGLVILTLSLGFFYLYLIHVYPIEELI